MFLYGKIHRYLKNDYHFFDALETEDPKIRGNCNLLTKIKFHELEWNSPLTMFLREAYALYLDSCINDDEKCSFSTFHSLQPKNVLLMRNSPLHQCKCQIHENLF